jgi:aspartyl-tRNA(Asn)/glutamyl-tRNA(Gln) amidotransferase subunit B
MPDIEVIIGLEVHVQIRTNTKMFCSCPNEYGSAPNTNVCPVCMGYPGVLPVPNHTAIRRTIRAGIMCNCEIASYSKFDRKSYFYPDMPKNYQTTQFDLPFCGPGHLIVEGEGLYGDEVEPKRLGITRIHLEEDVAKSTHFSKSTGVDFNRAGVPLMEIVSEPDMRSADEAYLYLTALKQMMQYAEVSDCDMEKGQMRCDVNISLRHQGDTHFNTKTELKNLNSHKAVHRAIEFEIDRLTELLEQDENGKSRMPADFKQSTRGWNDERGESYLMREKEDAHDYRYFPCPDLMPVTISAEELETIRAETPETPKARAARFEEELGLPTYDAGVLTADKTVADWFEAALADDVPTKKLSNWVMTELLREISANEIAISDCLIKPQQLCELVRMIEKGQTNGKIAKQVFAEMYKSGKDPATIIKENDWGQQADGDVIAEFAQAAIDANPGPVADYQSGNANALNFLVGQIMKASRGKANPQVARDALKAILD